MNPKFTQKQLKSIEKFSQLTNTIIPQLDKPLWLIKFLSKILPDYCIFERAYFYKGILIMYIPKLCGLNPYFNAIMYYRLSTYEINGKA